MKTNTALLRLCFAVVFLLCYSFVVTAFAADKQQEKNISPFGKGYCKFDEDSLFLRLGPGTVFEGYVDTVNGQPVQRAKLSKANSIPEGTATVEILNEIKKKVGSPKKLKLISSKWNDKLKTIDLSFNDDNMQLLLHTTYNLSGFTINSLQCTDITASSNKQK